jgi:hypothetical protein
MLRGIKKSRGKFIHVFTLMPRDTAARKKLLRLDAA